EKTVPVAQRISIHGHRTVLLVLARLYSAGSVQSLVTRRSKPSLPRRRAIQQLSTHLIQVNQSAVHDALAGASLGRRYRRVGAIAAFARCLDGREILLIIVAVPQKKQVLQSRSSFQAERVTTKELA